MSGLILKHYTTGLTQPPNEVILLARGYSRVSMSKIIRHSHHAPIMNAKTSAEKLMLLGTR